MPSHPKNLQTLFMLDLERLSGKLPKLLVETTDLIRLGQVPTPVGEPPLVVADALSRLSKEVGWLPKYDLATGLNYTIDWWKLRLF